jgi:hypothetical protein
VNGWSSEYDARQHGRAAEILASLTGRQPGGLDAADTAVLAEIGRIRGLCGCPVCGAAEAAAVDLAAKLGAGQLGWRQRQLAVAMLQIAARAAAAADMMPERRPRWRHRSLAGFAIMLARAAHELYTGLGPPPAPAAAWPEMPGPREPRAGRDWWLRAEVCIKHEYAAVSLTGETRMFAAGDKLELLQFGKKDQPVDRSWWHLDDAAGHYMFPASVVDVVAVTDRQSPLAG